MRFSTIKRSVKLGAPPDEVFEALVDSKKHAAFTGSPARITRVVGGRFSAWDGYIFGRNLELVRGRRVVQEWATTEWPEGYPPSLLQITLTTSGKGTVLKMAHTVVPAEQRNQHVEGWREWHWAPLRRHLEGRR